MVTSRPKGHLIESKAGRSLQAVPLTWEHCESLHLRVAQGDAYECLSLGFQPLQALASGALLGTAWAALRKHTGTPAGAFGFTPHGTMWSLWSPLSPGEARQVFQESVQWVKAMVEMSGRDHLYNYVSARNKPALAWLKASPAFEVDPGVWTQGEYHYFRSAPIEVNHV